MATEDGLANGDPSSPGPKNPFNFQTQFISAGPVKSVSGSSSRGNLRCLGVVMNKLTDLTDAEHRPTTRSPL
jgi:hypothetical protein